MFLCSKCLRIVPSLKTRSTSMLLPMLWGSRSLMAASCLVYLCSPKYTFPNPPYPSSLILLYWPKKLSWLKSSPWDMINVSQFLRYFKSSSYSSMPWGLKILILLFLFVINFCSAIALISCKVKVYVSLIVISCSTPSVSPFFWIKIFLYWSLYSNSDI